MTPRIYSSSNCGWAVRNYAVLLLKGVPFTMIPAKDESGEKTDEFLRATPLGLTPCLVNDFVSVWESRTINDFLDEHFPAPSLMPADPPSRAEGRCWMHYCDNVLIPRTGAVMKQEEGAIGRLAAGLDELHDRTDIGDVYFYDSGFSLVDVVFYTLFDLIDGLRHMDLAEPFLHHTWLHQWAENTKAEPCLRLAGELPGLLNSTPVEVSADCLNQFLLNGEAGVVDA